MFRTRSTLRRGNGGTALDGGGQHGHFNMQTIPAANCVRLLAGGESGFCFDRAYSEKLSPELIELRAWNGQPYILRFSSLGNRG